MEGYLGSAYLWVKALHIIFVIFWMAGMFMMPRYLAYHAECEPGSDEDGKWIEREKRLMHIIINPSITLVWILGLMLAFNIGWDSGGWLHAKLFIVFLFSGYHGMLSRWRKDYAKGDRRKDGKFFRKVNEVPAVVIILVVILAVVRPF